MGSQREGRTDSQEGCGWLSKGVFLKAVDGLPRKKEEHRSKEIVSVCGVCRCRCVERGGEVINNTAVRWKARQEKNHNQSKKRRRTRFYCVAENALTNRFKTEAEIQSDNKQDFVSLYHNQRSAEERKRKQKWGVYYHTTLFSIDDKRKIKSAHSFFSQPISFPGSRATHTFKTSRKKERGKKKERKGKERRGITMALGRK